MTLTLTSTPSPTPFLLGNTPLSLTLATAFGLHPNWATTDGGSFSNRHGETPTFTPSNNSQNVVIKGRRVTWMGDGSGLGWVTIGANLASSGSFGNLTKALGGTAWNAFAIGATSGNSDEVFLEFTTAEADKEKAAGLTQNGSNADPTNTSAPFLDFTWHLFADGTAQARQNGVLIGPTVTYLPNTDIFKVYRKGSVVYYMLNEKAITQVAIASGTWNLYPFATIRQVGGTIQNGVTFTDTGETKQGTLAFEEYGVFPVQPNYTYELSADSKVLVSYAEDGSSVLRKKGNIKKSLSVQFVNRPYTEYLLINDFWEWHQRDKKFKYVDVIFNKTYTVVFDAGMRIQVVGPDQITMTAVLRET